jgi:hypothetical protein
MSDAVGFDFVVRGLLDLSLVQRSRSVAVGGVGSVAVAEALHDGRHVTIVDSAGPLSVLRTAAGPIPAAFAGAWPECDLVVSALALAHRSDEEAVAQLTALAAGSGRAIVIEQLDGDGLGPPDIAEHRLVEMAASGAAIRSASDIAGLAAAAGWALDGRSTLGWNYEAFELRR